MNMKKEDWLFIVGLLLALGLSAAIVVFEMYSQPPQPAASSED